MMRIVGENGDAALFGDLLEAAVGKLGQRGGKGGEDGISGMSACERDGDGRQCVEDVVVTQDQTGQMGPVRGIDVGGRG